MMFTAAAVVGGERLDRGVGAFPKKDGGVYVGWRLLAGDPDDIAFDVYRCDSPSDAGRKLNRTPIANSTNFIDADAVAGNKSQFYRVHAIGRSIAAADCEPVAVDAMAEIGRYRRIKLQGNYGVQKVGLADLDGDGNDGLPLPADSRPPLMRAVSKAADGYSRAHRLAKKDGIQKKDEKLGRGMHTAVAATAQRRCRLICKVSVGAGNETPLR